MRHPGGHIRAEASGKLHFGGFWEDLGSLGSTWDGIISLGALPIIWDHLASSGIIWAHLGSSFIQVHLRAKLLAVFSKDNDLYNLGAKLLV